MLTTAASHILDGFKPAYELTVTANLWAAGAAMLGKVNLDEFAMGSSNETSYYGPVINPWRRKRNGALDNTALVPGGSSGGSAAAVAAHLCLGATGTDTGGSIRQPAALHRHCRHQADLWALLALGHRCVRLLARSGGTDGEDGARRGDPAQGDGGARSQGFHLVDAPVPDYEAAIGQSIKGVRIGIPKEYRIDGLDPEIDALWQKGIEWLKAAGAEIKEISLPHTQICAAGLLHRRAGRGLVQSRAL